MLLDVGLPDGDGLVLCRSLRDDELDTPDDGDPRVLMLTARGQLEDSTASCDSRGCHTQGACR